MKDEQQHLEDLSEIRSLMEKSSRFLSLSGLSGVFAGIYALIGAFLAFDYVGTLKTTMYYSFYGEISSHRDYLPNDNSSESTIYYSDILLYFFLIAFGVLFMSLITGFYFTRRKAKRKGLKLWDKIALRMVLNLAIPLIAGGLFCLVLIFHGIIGLVAPATLIFYGLALLNASKYTLNDIRYLGISEIILGLICSFYIGNGLLFWAIGFGVLHILYGAVMYFKYERS